MSIVCIMWAFCEYFVNNLLVLCVYCLCSMCSFCGYSVNIVLVFCG